jgi:hypothetical protein
MTIAAVRRDAVIVACAVSAGIHAAVAPAHFAEGARAGVAFAAAAVALGALAAALTLAPASRSANAGAVVVLAGLLASYALAVTSGLPLLHPEPEAVDGLGVFTKAIEAVGVVLAATLIRQPKGRSR